MLDMSFTNGLLGSFEPSKLDSMLSGYAQLVITKYVSLLLKNMYIFHVDDVIGDVIDDATRLKNVKYLNNYSSVNI